MGPNSWRVSQVFGASPLSDSGRVQTGRDFGMPGAHGRGKRKQPYDMDRFDSEIRLHYVRVIHLMNTYLYIYVWYIWIN